MTVDIRQSSSQEQTVAVYIVTYRRHQMLERAIESVLTQSWRNLTLYIVNDDPQDAVVERIVRSISDARIQLFQPVEKRGAVRNFNLVFLEREATYSALLEDDNWWEPTFLESQITILQTYPEMPLVVSNERVWKELPGNSWEDTKRTVWSFRDLRVHEATLEGLCGSAVLCNSSMLVRTQGADRYVIPDFIPVDVTEHFRERLMPKYFLLNGEPLANYSETIMTSRDSGPTWGRYQFALIGSIFLALPHDDARSRLAKSLWQSVSCPTSPRATTLVGTGLTFVEARSLLWQAPIAAIARTGVNYTRHPSRLFDFKRVREEFAAQIDFLANTSLVRELASQVV